jgi:hypothetical protein
MGEHAGGQHNSRSEIPRSSGRPKMTGSFEALLENLHRTQLNRLKRQLPDQLLKDFVHARESR